MSKKRNLNNDIDSLFETMQEVYRDCDEQKRKIMNSITTRKNKWEAEDVEDESKLGNLELNAMKLLNDVIDKKVKLIVIHAKLVGTKQDSSNSSDTGENAGLTSAEIKALTEMARGTLVKETNYDLSNKK